MNKRLAAAILGSFLVGAVLGPPIVQAATRSVTIKGAGTTNRAKVTKRGALKVDTEAGVQQGFLNTFAVTSPSGIVTLADGTQSTTVPADFGILTNAVVDMPLETSPVTVTLADDVGLIWQGTVDGGNRHLNDGFDHGLFWVGNLDVTVTGTGARFVLEGLRAGGAGTSRDFPLRDLERLRR